MTSKLPLKFVFHPPGARLKTLPLNAPSVTGAAVVLVQGTIPEPSSAGLIVAD